MHSISWCSYMRYALRPFSGSLRTTSKFPGVHQQLTRRYTGQQPIESSSELEPEQHARIAARQTLVARPVCTLDPRKLIPSDFIDISGRPSPVVHMSGLVCMFRYHTANALRVPFPPNTRGFLYYKSPPEAAPLAGEIRFRLVENGDPASFSQGSDLMSPIGTAWRIHISVVVLGHSCYLGLRESLLKDELVTQAMINKILKMGFNEFKGYTIHSLDEPFPLSFSVFRHSVQICRGNNGGKVVLKSLFRDQRTSKDHITQIPYTGTGLACFERSNLLEHKKTNTLVMRLLKIVDPVTCVIPDYDNYIPMPREGELISCPTVGGLHIWTWNIASAPKFSEPLQYLFAKRLGRDLP